jgi:hypothetical protein
VRDAVKFRNTLLLILVFGLLSGYFFLVENDNGSDPSKNNKMMSQTFTLFDYPETDVIELDLSDGEKRTIIRRIDEYSPWELVEPVHGEAEEDRVSFFVQRFVSLKADRVITETEVVENLAAYGLETPRAEGTMKLKNGRELTIYVGDKTPELTNRYVQVQGEENTVYLVGILLPNYIVDFVDKPPRKPTPKQSIAPTFAATLSMTPTPSDGTAVEDVVPLLPSQTETLSPR